MNPMRLDEALDIQVVQLRESSKTLAALATDLDLWPCFLKNGRTHEADVLLAERNRPALCKGRSAQDRRRNRPLSGAMIDDVIRR